MTTSILSAIPKEYSFLAPFREKRSGVEGGVDGNGISGVVDGDMRVSRKMATIEEEEEEEDDNDNNDDSDGGDDDNDEENNDGDDEDEDD